LFVSEAEVTPNQVDSIQLAGYDVELADSLKLGKARLVAYVKSRLLVHRKHEIEGDSENLIVFENKTIRVAGVYRGFKNYRQPGFNSLDYLFDRLQEICKTSKDVVLTGDFNIDPERDSFTPQGKKLEELIINNLLFQLVEFNTRFRVVQRQTGMSAEESRLDLVLSNRVENKVIQSEPTTSDHVLVCTTVKCSNVKPVTIKKTIRDWTNLTPCNVARLASGAPDPTNLAELSDSMAYLLEKLAPPRVVRTRMPENLVNPKIEKIKKRRERAIQDV